MKNSLFKTIGNVYNVTKTKLKILDYSKCFTFIVSHAWKVQCCSSQGALTTKSFLPSGDSLFLVGTINIGHKLLSWQQMSIICCRDTANKRDIASIAATFQVAQEINLSSTSRKQNLLLNSWIWSGLILEVLIIWIKNRHDLALSSDSLRLVASK